MTFNFIQPKGSLNTKTNADDIAKQYAQIFANQQLQNQAQAQAEAVDPMRQTVQDLLKNKLIATIETPEYTTLEDVLNAKKGDKLGVFADFLNNPNTMRTIGNILPKYGYNPQTGKLGNVMEEDALRKQAEMEKAQARALQEQKEQNDIATALNNAYMTSDIHKADREARQKQFEEEMEWAKQKHADDVALARQKMANALTVAGMIHGGGGGSATGLAAALTPKQMKDVLNINGKSYLIPGMSTSDRGKIRDNNAIIKSLEDGLKIIEKNPNAFGVKGASPAWVQSIAGSEGGNQARSQIGGLAKEYKKYLTGVASNQTEEKDFLRYVPAPFDNAKTMRAKINAIKNIAESKNAGMLNTYYHEELDNFGGGNISSNKDPMGLGL